MSQLRYSIKQYLPFVRHYVHVTSRTFVLHEGWHRLLAEVCESRGAPKPSWKPTSRQADACEPLPAPRGQRPSAQCAASLLLLRNTTPCQKWA